MWAFTESIIFAAEGVNIARGIKTWHTDMKWANGVGNMEPKAGSKVDKHKLLIW